MARCGAAVTLCVLDSSAALGWMLPDEAGDAAAALLDAVETGGAVVPSLWPLEIANALLMAERRQRLTAPEADEARGIVGGLPIQIEPMPVARAMHDITSLARSHGLTAYDASYLELAVRRALPLATQDAALRRAASACGVPVLL
jgi:predicted nucleic acid-binding protein